MTQPVTTSPPDGRCGTWLYLSRSLSTVLLPDTEAYSRPVIFLGPGAATPYWRLTPEVLVWFQLAGETLEAKWRLGRDGVTRDAVDEFLKLMEPVYAFAAERLDEATERIACRAARNRARAEGADVLLPKVPREMLAFAE